MARRRRRPAVAKLLCSKCGETKTRDSFVNDRSRAGGKFPWCKACVTESRKSKPKRVTGEDGPRKCPICLVGLEGTHHGRKYCSERCKGKAYRLKLFGLTPEEYKTLTSGTCPICNKKVKRWEIDHNHTTGEVTGAVCRVCNGFLLAYTYHDAGIAKRLASYLENPPVNRLLGERRYVGPPDVSQLHRMWAWSGEGNKST